jgi:hypothetical protein
MIKRGLIGALTFTFVVQVTQTTTFGPENHTERSKWVTYGN